MIVKMMARGSGGGSGPVEYLLGKDRKREDALLLDGDPDQIIDLINSSDYAQRYTSGVLSFNEDNLTESAKREIMASFEATLLAGMDKNQYSILWVEHRDKGRLELNFVIPNVELTTGKRLQPYYHAIDLKRVDTWKRTVNYDYKLHDPDDPKNARIATAALNINMPKDRKQLIQVINSAVISAVKQQVITNSNDVVRFLKENNFNVTRRSPKTISIKDPSGGKNIKLKGSIYERDFEFSAGNGAETKEKSRHYAEESKRLYDENVAKLQELNQKKSTRNRELYASKQQDRRPINVKDVELSTANDLADSLAWRGGDMVHRTVNNGKYEHDISTKENDSAFGRKDVWDRVIQGKGSPLHSASSGLHRDISSEHATTDHSRINQGIKKDDSIRATITAGIISATGTFRKIVYFATRAIEQAQRSGNAASRIDRSIEQIKKQQCDSVRKPFSFRDNQLVREKPQQPKERHEPVVNQPKGFSM